MAETQAAPLPACAPRQTPLTEPARTPRAAAPATLATPWGSAAFEWRQEPGLLDRRVEGAQQGVVAVFALGIGDHLVGADEFVEPEHRSIHRGSVRGVECERLV